MVGARISGDEMTAGGLTAADLAEIGDCVAPRGIHQAILEGTRAARAV